MSFIGIWALSLFIPEFQETLIDPYAMLTISCVSVILWLIATIYNTGDYKYLIFLVVFGLLSPFCGAFIVGLTYGFGGVIGGLILVAKGWYIASPIGLITGLMAFFATKNKIVNTSMTTANNT